MISSSRDGVFAIAVVVIMALGLTACSSAPESSAEEASESHLAEATEEHAADGASAEVGDPAEDESEEGAEHRERGEAGEHEDSGERSEHGEEGEAREGGEHREQSGDGEHERGDHDEGGEGEGEESGVYIGREDAWDATRLGARLVLAFDAASDAFRGRVQNTTASVLCAVRVEVHLSTGLELGPTGRADLSAGQSIEVEIPYRGESVRDVDRAPRGLSLPRPDSLGRGTRSRAAS